MKGSAVAFFLGLLIIAVGIAWIVTGGPVQATSEVSASPVPTPIPTTIPATIPPTPVPAETTASPAPVRTSIPITTPMIITTVQTPEKPVSSDQVREHFLNIAYTATNKLERLNYTAGQDRLIISVISPAETDTATISSAVREFNAVSRTVTISEMIKESSNGDIVIKFLPENGLAGILLNDIPEAEPGTETLTRREFSYGGIPSAKVLRGTIYINSNLKGDARNHTLARCLYYQLGITGETTDYSDSLFYAGENTNTRLNAVDKKAVAILYEPALANSMTMEDLKKVIYIP